jgi:hypothetical protein
MDMAAGTGDGRRLRSADWFGEPGRMGAIYRSWVRGYTPEVFDGRPVIGIADSWSELTPCNAYLRQRAADWHTFWATLPQRVAGVLATAAGAGLLTATAANPGLARLVGPATAAGLAWRLRFRPSADTLAWRHGAQGERRTGRLLAPLERAGYQVFHDLAVPGSAANVDHLVVGPTGVYVIDSKRYSGQLRYSGGHLWRGSRSLDRTLETLWWEATQVAETLAFGSRPSYLPGAVRPRRPTALASRTRCGRHPGPGRRRPAPRPAGHPPGPHIRAGRLGRQPGPRRLPTRRLTSQHFLGGSYSSRQSNLFKLGQAFELWPGWRRLGALLSCLGFGWYEWRAMEQRKVSGLGSGW